ncbi:MAG TPA: hypothetical protein VL485_08260 [Ktedonobacteraceae bacterium]|nr:hypothetical protein [Ktedonobacteraceae bacterium]
MNLHADWHEARSLPQPFFEGWGPHASLAKRDPVRKTQQVGSALHANPRPPPDGNPRAFASILGGGCV